ncbi:U3 snoRNP protein [Serendipita sp. 411]|nr:U3 snoRNP protein [Serendipita sp. 400]KAG8849582.1 U3 snoRNP protein [Serendipita sp. 411]
MERVQYSLESFLPELKDLQENGIFSAQEVREIIKRRTHFETQLVRRQPRKKDFLEYIEYEMALEKLRKKRVARMKTPPPHSISSHSIRQRQFSIFERAMRKFKADIRLWVQYIEVAKKENAGNLVGRVVAKALKLHPTSVPLYVLAAQHQLDQGSPSAARNLLQRGLRLNAQSADLWCEYIKMELGWCELLRRRWETLGIPTNLENLSAAENAEVATSSELDVKSARKEVLKGAIVKEVLKDALKAQPSLRLFNALSSTLEGYPTPLAIALIPFLYDLLNQHQKFVDCNAAELLSVYASRHLKKPDLTGKDLIAGLKANNQELLDAMQTARESGDLDFVDDLAAVYSEFVWNRWSSTVDPNLRLYLSSSLHNLCNSASDQDKPGGKGVGALYSTHLRILLDRTHPSPRPDGSKISKLARKYSSKSTSVEVWLCLLDIENQNHSNPALKAQNEKNLLRSARKICRGESLEKIWCYAWDTLTLGEKEDLIKEALSNSETAVLREVLLLRTISSLYLSTPEDGPSTRSKNINRLLRSYSLTSVVYRHAFELEEAQPETDTSLLQDIFHLWRDAGGLASNREDATFAYASHLLNERLVKGANILINNLIALSIEGNRKEVLEKRWRDTIDNVEGPVPSDAINLQGDTVEVWGNDGMDVDESSEEEEEEVDFVVVG